MLQHRYPPAPEAFTTHNSSVELPDEAFVSDFDGARAPLTGVKRGAGRGQPQEVEMITGATISSRTVISVINHRIEALQPLLAAHLQGGGS